MFTLKMHNETGQELWLYQNQLSSFAVIISRAYPLKHRLTLAALRLTGEKNAILKLRGTLDDISCCDFTNLAAEKIYFRGGRKDTPHLKPLEGLGLAKEFTDQFQQTQRTKALYSTGSKHGFSVFELTCILLALRYIAGRLTFIMLKLSKLWPHNDQPMTLASNALRDTLCLIDALGDELPKAALQQKIEV